MNLQNEKQLEERVGKNDQNSYEEISEKRTSKLGYVLLIVMVAFVIGVGETIFSDLARIPEGPISPSACVMNPVRNPKNLTKYSICQNSFNDVDKKFGLDEKYNNILPQLQEIASLNASIESNNSEIRKAESDIQRLNREYNLTLQEKMAGEKSIANKENIKDNITNTKVTISSLQEETRSLESKKSLSISQISSAAQSIEQSHKEATDYFLNKVAWLKFKVFLLTLVFVLPFFAFSVFFYFKLKRKNSPYTIILTATTTAFAILFLQVVGVFLYDILPKEWLERIFKFFMEVPFLRYVIYYGSVIVVIVIFGGIVYYIQKKVFSSAKIAIRRLKDKKCPKCSFSLDSQHIFCPNCGLQLKEKCKHCGELKVKYLSHCPNCGKDEVEKTSA
ncbi:MAG: hypothetical protein UT50_C0023G0002 [Candidatus Moranbacteria bacterium GW2011_GWA2_39_41]|nr:MAG: hypothetical protein UT50_C0023G0002 [Candidatus Moranbacteria bacterium GW2011_GWA2_39_41]